ncbi:DUF4136 domain-containing protein [Lacinutrix sp. WUR7]|uniref:DUF4136 domain-containing protein n=1 Tax=Lacinutrix sp. WUR7 TaxID=2653681 RepID=UPI00193DCE92|nr:DUF4136 domain-containing protein [Lacinutrix sp. WUR7]QRM90525.1 DUF4136 domain-containing protein [Lacinutrix sp. WUR7]
MRSLKALYIFLFTVLIGCAASVDILSEYDEEVDFNEYKTFMLCLDDFQVDNTQYPNLDNTYVRELIAGEVDKHMTALGYRTNVFSPQLQAGFKIAITEEETFVKNCELDNEFDYWLTCTINTVIYTKETLILYVSDIEKNQVIWQATIPCDLDKSKPGLRKHINTLVDQLFLEFPEVNK